MKPKNASRKVGSLEDSTHNNSLLFEDNPQPVLLNGTQDSFAFYCKRKGVPYLCYVL